eukprot:3863399-Prymnesium_polylepis.1
MSLEDKFILVCQIYFGLIGGTFSLAPWLLWEDSAIVPVVMTIWTGSLTPQTEWFARAFGVALVLLILGPQFGGDKL